MVHFDECEHKWEFAIDAGRSWWPNSKPWQAFYICKKCGNEITMQEKCALEQTIALKESLKVQEKSLDTAKKAMMISAVMMILGVVWLWLEKIFR